MQVNDGSDSNVSVVVSVIHHLALTSISSSYHSYTTFGTTTYLRTLCGLTVLLFFHRGQEKLVLTVSGLGGGNFVELVGPAKLELATCRL